MKYNEKEFLWVEKYRPQTIDDLIVPSELEQKLKEFREQGKLPNIGLFSAYPGIGKSSTWNAIIGDMNVDTLIINCSKDNGIDVLRSEITSFITKKSIMNEQKLVILDEADYLTTNAQAGLRRDIEEFSQNASFFLTGNYKDKIIPALLDRLQVFEIDVLFNKEKQEIGKKMVKRLKEICEIEGVKYDLKDLAQLVKEHYPSLRKMIQELQKNVINGELKLQEASNKKYNDIIELIKAKKFAKVKSFVEELSMPETFYSWMWKNLDFIVKPQGQIQVIPLLAQYQDMSSRVMNKQIPLMTLFIELMKLDGVWNE